MAGPKYTAPHGGRPPQTQLLTGRSVFTEAYVVIPKGVMRTSSPARCRSGRERASGSCRARFRVSPRLSRNTSWRWRRAAAATGPSRTPAPRAYLFVVEGEITVTLDGEAHRLQPGGYAFLPPACGWSVRNERRRRRAFPLDPQALRARSTASRCRRRCFATSRTSCRCRCRAPRGAGRPRASSIPTISATTCTSTSSPSNRAASSPLPKPMSWSTASMCWKARRSTASTRTGSRSRPATTCGCAPSARRPAMPAAPAASATCSTRTSIGT